jgi:predicted metal-dependent hydrolase
MTTAAKEPRAPRRPAAGAGSAGDWHDAEDLRWAVRHWASRIGVKVTRVQLRPLNAKWASISTSGRLTLSTELLEAPKELGEYVIVHELCHLLMPNHGQVFKLFLAAYLPDWEERQHQLDRWGLTKRTRLTSLP